MHVIHLECNLAKLTNLELKTRLKQRFLSLLLNIVLPVKNHQTIDILLITDLTTRQCDQKTEKLPNAWKKVASMIEPREQKHVHQS